MPDSALESLIHRLNDHIDNPGPSQAPDWLVNSWSPLLFAKTLKNCLVPLSDMALDNIEQYLLKEAEAYSPLKDLDDTPPAELGNLEDATLFWRHGEVIRKDLGAERVKKLDESVKTALSSLGGESPPEGHIFNRGNHLAFKSLLELAERQDRFWRLLLCLDEYLQGRCGPLAELVERPDCSELGLTEEEKNELKRESMRGAPEKIKDRLRDEKMWLSALLSQLAPDKSQPQIKIDTYTRAMSGNILRQYEQICLALPQVSGFYETCNKILDHKGTRRGYTDPDTGARVTVNIPQYTGGKFGYGHLLAEANYKQAIEALTDKDEKRTLYIVALPEYYYPLHLHIGGDKKFIKRLQYIRNNGQGIIFISGLEGLKKDIHSNKPPNNGCYSKALIAYSDSTIWKHHIVGHGKMLIFSGTPLGAIGISTYGSIYSMRKSNKTDWERFEEALTAILRHSEGVLSYIFVCFMNDNEGKQKKISSLVENKIRPLLGETRLVVTDHDCCYTGNKPPRKFAHNSIVYDKKGAMNNYAEINYVLDGCKLFSKLFIIN